MKNCPDYFKAPNGEVYPCTGTDDGYYWAENPENSFELWKFEQSECQPLSAMDYLAHLSTTAKTQ